MRNNTTKIENLSFFVCLEYKREFWQIFLELGKKIRKQTPAPNGQKENTIYKVDEKDQNPLA